LIFIDGNVDAKIKPLITVMGTVTNFNTEDHTFMMTPTQYVVLPRAASPFPIHAHFVDSESKKRWGTEGPRVAVGSTITFAGFMERIVHNCNINRTLAFVEIEVTIFPIVPMLLSVLLTV